MIKHVGCSYCFFAVFMILKSKLLVFLMCSLCFICISDKIAIIHTGSKHIWFQIHQHDNIIKKPTNANILIIYDEICCFVLDVSLIFDRFCDLEIEIVSFPLVYKVLLNMLVFLRCCYEFEAGVPEDPLLHVCRFLIKILIENWSTSICRAPLSICVDFSFRFWLTIDQHQFRGSPLHLCRFLIQFSIENRSKSISEPPSPFVSNYY
jgi:hypothetical protein